MYSFPNMQRNSAYKTFVNTSLFLCFLIFYNAFSSMYLFLPPLFGILFLYFINLFEKERFYSLLFFIIVLFVFESDKGFYPGILFILYYAVYVFLFPKIVKIFDNFNLFEIFYVPIIYISYFIIYFIIFSVYDDSNGIFTSMLFVYIFEEVILVLVIRWILGIK